MSDIQNVLLGGFGSTGSVSLIVTSGFSVGAAVPEVVAERAGGGRVFRHFPYYEEKKKPVVRLKWTDDKEKELTALLRKIDEDFEKKRAEQFQELLEILRTAIYLGNEVSLSGFDYLKEQDLVAAKRKLQQEEEEILLLVA